jgi:hypothetical protein
MNQRIYLTMILSVLVSAAGAADKQWAALPSHCDLQEQVIFSCMIGKRMASLCASRDLTKNSGYVQYR